MKEQNIKMVVIPAGEIVLRDDRIKHQWKVEIQPFLLAKFPVTQDIYYAITQKAPFYFKGDRLPVESVSWNEAVLCMMKKNMGLSGCFVVADGMILKGVVLPQIVAGAILHLKSTILDFG